MTTAWGQYRACPVCRTGWGRPCKSRSGRIVDGQPDGCETTLDEPHRARLLRTAYRAARA
jgi:hypothetical protein